MLHRRRSREVLETITIKLFQDENTPGPRLKPDEEYMGSLLDKYGDIISHNYRRQKISPDDPPPQPRLKIWGVCPPAKMGEKDKEPADSLTIWSKEELTFLIKNI